MGKTSLIRRVAQSVPGCTEVYVDLFGARSAQDVVTRLAKSVAVVDSSSKWGIAVAKAPHLTPTSIEFLTSVGEKAQGPSVLKAFRQFEKDGVLMKTGPRFEFVNPFFREWLKTRLP
jgi:hypothetical protein